MRRRYKCTTMSEHDQPVAPNLLARQFEADGAKPTLGRRHHRAARGQRQALPGRRPRPVLALRRRLGAERGQRSAPHAQSAGHGAAAALSRGRTAPSLGPGQHVRERGLPERPRRARHHLQHEPARQLLRQRRDGELVLDVEDRARRTLRQPRATPSIELFDYIEVFYNQKRRHSSLGYATPAEVERRYSIGDQPSA